MDLRGVFGQDGCNYLQLKEWNRKTDATGANLDEIALFKNAPYRAAAILGYA